MLEQWEQDIINSKIRHPIYSLEWLTSDEQVIDETIVDVVSGNVNFDVTQNNRRSASITLKNINKKYIPSSNSKLWIDHKIRLKSGYEYGVNQKLWYNQGIYLLGNPSLLSSPSQKEVSIQLNDKWLLLNGEVSGKLKNKFIIPVGTRIDDVVKSLIELAGETKYIIDECDYETPYTIEKPINDNIANILVELANLYSYEVYYDNEGFLNFRKALEPEDIETTPPSWAYTTSGLYLQSTRELGWSDIRNSILIYGSYDDDTGIQHQGSAVDETGSEFSVDKIGERVEILELNEIYSNELCEQRASYELFKRIKQQEKVTATIIPNFSHETGQLISLEDEANGTSGNYLIQTISYSLGHDSQMQLGLWKSRNWG